MTEEKIKDQELQQNQALSTGSIESYCHWVNQIPMLTEAEEKELTRRLHEENDVEAARRLVMAHLRYVVSVARGYKGYGLPLADLIQEGNVGLMKAVKRFDPKHGVKLVTFAMHWVKSEIHEFVIRNWKIVKLATTKAQRKLFFNLRKASKQKRWLSHAEVEKVAEDLNVSEKEVRTMEMRMSGVDESFDPVEIDDESGGFVSSSPAQRLTYANDNPAELVTQQDTTLLLEDALHVGLAELDDRSREILKKRWLVEKKATLHQLADEYGVSAERIRQLEKTAMAKLRESMVVAEVED